MCCCLLIFSVSAFQQGQIVFEELTSNRCYENFSISFVCRLDNIRGTLDIYSPSIGQVTSSCSPHTSDTRYTIDSDCQENEMTKLTIDESDYSLDHGEWECRLDNGVKRARLEVIAGKKSIIFFWFYTNFITFNRPCVKFAACSSYKQLIL